MDGVGAGRGRTVDDTDDVDIRDDTDMARRRNGRLGRSYSSSSSWKCRKYLHVGQEVTVTICIQKGNIRIINQSAAGYIVFIACTVCNRWMKCLRSGAGEVLPCKP